MPETSGPNLRSDAHSALHSNVTFLDSTSFSATSPQNVPPVPSLSSDPYADIDLKKFLSRPYYAQYVWPSSAVHGQLLMRISLPNFLFARIPLFRKLQNFGFFRAGVRIGVRINGSKFHYGQLLVSWSPQTRNTGDLQYGTNCVYSQSGCPSMLLSPSDNETHEMVLPYALPYNYINLENYWTNDSREWEMATVSIMVLNPLQNAGTATDVTFTLFANFENVELAGPTFVAQDAPGVWLTWTQSNLPAILPAGNPSNINSFLESHTGDPEPAFDARLQAQGLAAPVSEANAKTTEGTISSALETVGTISGALVEVPEIGPIAEAVSVAANIGSKIAGFFGFSKPVTQAVVNLQTMVAGDVCQTHGLDTARTLAITQENAVKSAATLMGSHEREMQFNHLFSTPSLFAANIGWTTAYPAGTQIFSASVCPTMMYKDTNNVTYPSILAWAATPFEFWRGTICYHLQIVASQMHTGRLRITWDPSDSAASPGIDFTTNQISLVIDISKQTEISFAIPYLKERAWEGNYAIAQKTSDPALHYRNGVIRISVLNSLNHPFTPVPNVYMNLWVYAGSDFQVARPTIRGMSDTFYILNIPPEEEEESVEGKLVAQGLTRELIRDSPAAPLIPATGAVEKGLLMGEEIRHLKDVLMRPGVYTQDNLGFFAGKAPGTYCEFVACPFLANLRGDAATAPSFYEHYRYLYRYARGSFMWRFIPYGSLAQTTMDETSKYVNFSFFYNGGVWAVNGTYEAPIVIGNYFVPATMPVIFNSEGAHYQNRLQQNQGIVMPYYSTLYFTTNWAKKDISSPSLCRFDGYLPTIALARYTPGIVLGAPADDFEMGFIVGPPALSSS